MITTRPQQRYDHRLRELVQRTGDLTIATDRGVPRSTARGWIRTVSPVVVSLKVANLTEVELRQEVLTLQRRVHKLAALLRLALVLLRVSGFTLAGERLPDGHDKRQILCAGLSARTFCIFPRDFSSSIQCGEARIRESDAEAEDGCLARLTWGCRWFARGCHATSRRLSAW